MQTSEAVTSAGGNFTMLDPNGNPVGGTNDAVFTWDETLNTDVATAVVNATLTSDQPFFGVPWFAHDIMIYGPGTYTIYDGCPAGDPDCGVGTEITFTVGADQTGAHILFDYFPTVNIDVINVWDMDTNWATTNPANPFFAGPDDGTNCNPDGCVPDGVPNTSSTIFTFVSTDWNGNGIASSPMTDGGFPGFHASFNLIQALPEGTPVANDFTVFTDVDTDVPDIDMLANAEDGGEPGTILSLNGCTSPSAEGGTVTEDLPNDTCDYQSPGVLAVNDTFTYTVIDDADLVSAPGTVTIDIENEPPTCDPVSLSTSKDVALPIDEADLLENCTDPDGAEPLSVDQITAQPAHGTLSAALPPFEYIPDNGYTGPDSFQYTVSDTRGGVTTGTADITVSDRPFGNFTMADPLGIEFGGTNDVVSEMTSDILNDACNGTSFNMTIESLSGHPFFNFPWSAHDIRVFEPGSYRFDTKCSAAQVRAGSACDCGGDPDLNFLTLNVGEGQLGAHVLFDWNITDDIHVVLLWSPNDVYPDPEQLYLGPAGTTPAVDCTFELASIDADGDGIPGAIMINGPFLDFSANFNVNLTQPCEEGEIPPNPVSTIKSPSRGTSGCSISSYSQSTQYAGHWWLLAGFIGWLGWYRRKHIQH
jgi:hypothetical protein